MEDDLDPFPFTLPGLTGDRTRPDAPLLPDSTVAEPEPDLAGVDPGPSEEVFYLTTARVPAKQFGPRCSNESNHVPVSSSASPRYIPDQNPGENSDNNIGQETVPGGPNIHSNHESQHGNDIADAQEVQDFQDKQQDISDHEYDAGEGANKETAATSLIETAHKAVSMLPILCRLGDECSSSTSNVGTSLEPYSTPKEPRKRRAESADTGATCEEKDNPTLQRPEKRVRFSNPLREVREFEKEEEIEVGNNEGEEGGDDEADDENEGDDEDDDEAEDDEAEEESISSEQAAVTGNYTQVVDIEHSQPEGDGPTKRVTRSQKARGGPEPSQAKGKPCPATLSKALPSSSGESKKQAGPKKDQKEKPSLEKSPPKRKSSPVNPSKSKVDKPWKPVAHSRKEKSTPEKSSSEEKQPTPATPAKQRASNTKRKQQQDLSQDAQAASDIERTGALSRETAEERR
ncbi:MAG: hypothetical protein Q9221_003535 [Calogaya cf. arnoldii]